MVKRLLDEQGLQGTDSELAELFRAAAPFEVNAFRKRRILVSLERGQSHTRSRFWLRALGVGALLVTGSAAAAIGYRYAPGSFLLGFGGSRLATTASFKLAPKAVLASPAATVAPELSSAAPDPVAPEALAPSPARAMVKGSARARPESPEDAKHVVEAIHALRTDGDPSRAQALLNSYLKSHPHGVLSGDALALSIEAASAQHDPRALDYARRYLSAFPNGKYRALAERALANAGPSSSTPATPN